MTISARALHAEYKIRVWQRIIGENPYIAVLQLTSGTAWGRTNMKWRILGAPDNIRDGVGARYATPRTCREGALRTRFTGIAELFRAAPCAVIYGTDVAAVAEALRRAEQELKNAVLLGGRFGDHLVHAHAWREVLASDGEKAEFAVLVAALHHASPLVRALNAGPSGLARALDAASGRSALAGVLAKHATNLEGAASAQPS